MLNYIFNIIPQLGNMLSVQSYQTDHGDIIILIVINRG